MYLHFVRRKERMEMDVNGLIRHKHYKFMTYLHAMFTVQNCNNTCTEGGGGRERESKPGQ